MRIGSNAPTSSGTLDISGTGIVDVASLVLVGNGNAANTGSVSVSGNGQLKMNRLDIVSNINVAPGGTGSLSISGNGQVSTQGANPRIFIGSGQAGAGNATFSLADNGVVNSGHDFIIGFTSGSTGNTQMGGTINVDSPGSYFVGAFANGDMTQTGGLVSINAASPNGLRLGHGGGAVNGIYNLNGGTLELATLTSNSAGSEFNFGGGTLRANGTLNTAVPMTLTGVGGDANVDTNGNSAELSGMLSGPGGFQKSGAGDLTLSGANTYMGDTTVAGGVLSLTNAYLEDSADVYLTTGATLDLDFASIDTIDELFIDGLPQLTGTWGEIGSSADHQTALISGTGQLNVTATTLPEPGSIAIWSLMGLAAAGFAWRRMKSPT